MAVVEDRDNNKTHSHSHSHDQNISTSSITMSNNYTKDLFNKFIAVENQRRRCNIPLPNVKPVLHQKQRFVDAEEMDEEDFELSLGLSMNGRFGFDPNAKKIKRTTSIPESMMPVTIGGGSSSGGSGSGGGAGGGSLMRTCSLPVENEEEWRKRKELQSQRRMEAKKKRYEKQRNSRALRERSFGGGGGGGEGGGGSEGGSGNNNNNLMEVYVQGVGGESLIRTSSLTTRVGGLGLNGEKELDQVVPPSPQGGGGGSIGSSSGTSESEGQQHGQGKRICYFYIF